MKREIKKEREKAWICRETGSISPVTATATATRSSETRKKGSITAWITTATTSESTQPEIVAMWRIGTERSKFDLTENRNKNNNIKLEIIWWR